MVGKKMKSGGFTLIEMMVVVTLVSIMSMIVLNNYVAQRKAKELQFAPQIVTDAVRKAQRNSINIVKFGASDVSGGYGIHFAAASSSVLIFLDVSKDKTYSAGDEDVETINLPPSIYIDNLNDGTVAVGDIVFEPPYGKVSVAHDATLQVAGNLIITLKNSNGACPDACKTVKINSQGQIN